MAVETLDETKRFPNVDLVAESLQDLMAELDLGSRDVTLVLTSDEVIAAMNRRDRDVTGPTDVLSYPTSEPTDVNFPVIDHLGDIVISLDTAAKQAAEAGHDLLEEVAILAAHGLMHLAGNDHEDAEKWRPFEVAQRRMSELVARQHERTATGHRPEKETGS